MVGRSYSNHRRQGCIERLRLAGGGGWIIMALNQCPPGYGALAEMADANGSFEPRDPAGFHLGSVQRVMWRSYTPTTTAAAATRPERAKSETKGLSIARSVTT